MTKLTNEELLQKIADIGRFLTGPYASEPGYLRNWGNELETYSAEILKRMAEGAAGEASPQGDLLAALKAVLDVGRGPSGRLILERHDEEAIRAAIAKHESASASTAGPRIDVDMPQLIAQEILDDAFKPGGCCYRLNFTKMKAIIAKWWPNVITAGPRPRCPKCHSTGTLVFNPDFNEVTCRADHYGRQEEWKFAIRGMLDMAQFFAAAPAEDREKCFVCGGHDVGGRDRATDCAGYFGKHDAP